jgi:VWFA-related protein
MRKTAKLLTAGAFALLLAMIPAVPSTTAHAQVSGQEGIAPAPGQPTFRVAVDLVTTDVIVRDNRGQFVADLRPDELEVFEDGVRQELASFELVHGGRVYSLLNPPPARAPEGMILPTTRPASDTAGRIFLIFIDDLHLDFRQTARTRRLMLDMLRSLIHEGDMFGIVTTGTSSYSHDLTYDRQVLEAAVERISGTALRIDDILRGSSSQRTNLELRHNAHVAFMTAYDLMRNLERVQNRRKAVIYISSGYNFNPFQRTLFNDKLMETFRRMGGSNSGGGICDDLCESQQIEALRNQFLYDPDYITNQSQQMLAEADLLMQMRELTRAANRANATLYTIDPRGLIAAPDVDVEIDIMDFHDWVRETQVSLRVLAEETGGFAIVNMNDFDRGLKRIDQETSDYYMIGYYSSNPDPTQRRRDIEVRVARENVSVNHREEYYFVRPAAPAPLPPPSAR